MVSQPVLPGGRVGLHPEHARGQRRIRGWLPGTDITTPFVTLPGLISGECVSQGGFNYLSVTVNADSSDPRADDIGGDLTPEWGLHLIDVSIVMGDIVERVDDQAAAYAG